MLLSKNRKKKYNLGLKVDENSLIKKTLYCPYFSHFPCTSRRSILNRHLSKDQSLATTQLSYSVPDIIIAPKSLGADDF